mgnify:CR=1 FL=1
MACRTAWIAAIALAATGCAQRPPVVGATDLRADRLRAALCSLSEQKGYRAVRRVARDGRESVVRDLVLAPDYCHSIGEDGETFARGARVVRRTSSGRGWLREEVPTHAVGVKADVESLLRWGGPDARFAEGRTEDGCDVVEFSLDGEALARVVEAQGGEAHGASRVAVTVWIGADGLLRRARQRYEGASPVDIVCEFSDFGIDLDPEIPGPVRRLLDIP